MDRVNATIREHHREQLDTAKANAERDISDAEAARRVFDRAQRVNGLEQEVNDLEQQVNSYEQETNAHEQTVNEIAQEHEQELQETREEYEQRIEYLETQIERLQRTNLKILEQRDDVTDLQLYADEQREWNQAGLLTRTKWRLFGKDGSRASSSDV